MQDKYMMTKEENIFLAQKNLNNFIKQVIEFEGIFIDILDINIITKDIFLTEYQKEDQQIILNLKNAWNYIFNNINNPLTVQFCIDLNNEICFKKETNNANKPKFFLKKTNKTIPPLNSKEINTLNENIHNILSKDISITEKAIDLMLLIDKSQIFIEGNFNTAILIANKLLIENGKGILTIPTELADELKQLLNQYGTDNNSSNIKEFLYKNCLYGIEN